jgi:type III pantothenate kinase
VNLVIDIGNTLSKLAIFDHDEMVHFETSEFVASQLINDLFSKFQKIAHAIISTVAQIPEDLTQTLKNKNVSTRILDSKSLLPFKLKYKTPETLGKDRIAAVAGAYKLYPQKNVLVIDAGTAIKFDLINSKEEYLGGNISPGLDMRFKALNHFTARLPLLNQHENFSLIGASTTEAIINGVQNGLIFEIEGYVRELETIYPDLIILLTGGNAQFFEYKLKKTIFVVSNLTLIGLNTILEYNVHA